MKNNTITKVSTFNLGVALFLHFGTLSHNIKGFPLTGLFFLYVILFVPILNIILLYNSIKNILKDRKTDKDTDKKKDMEINKMVLLQFLFNIVTIISFYYYLIEFWKIIIWM